METFYHGGAPGLKPGDLILPIAATGAETAVGLSTKSVKKAYRRDRVYLTPDFNFALFFAARYKSPNGQVYVVEPIGELEKDPHWSLLNTEGTGYSETKQCERARVISVAEISPDLFEEARALMAPATVKGDPRRSTLARSQQRAARQTFEKQQRKKRRRMR